MVVIHLQYKTKVMHEAILKLEVAIRSQAMSDRRLITDYGLVVPVAVLSMD